jgi:pyrimidine deaminase RibD-like protein
MACPKLRLLFFISFYSYSSSLSKGTRLHRIRETTQSTTDSSRAKYTNLPISTRERSNHGMSSDRSDRTRLHGSNTIARSDHKAYMAKALSLARLSPPKSTNFCVGALLVDASANTILSTGYTLEVEGNTHAEECCFIKLATEHGIGAEEYEKLADILPVDTALYTTMEPCYKRLSGNMACVDRILALGKAIKTVYVGACEVEKFVGHNTGRSTLEHAGIKVVHVQGMEEEILEVAQSGHK